MRRCLPLLALTALLSTASVAGAFTLGLDARHGQPNDDTADPTGGFLANGSDYEQLRAQLVGEGYTLVPVTDFSLSNLASLGIDSLWLSHPFFQNYSDGVTGDPATFGYSAAEISGIAQFVSLGGGLLLLGEGGFGSEPDPGALPGSPGTFDGTANFDQIASIFGVSFASAATEPGGHTILELDDAHPVTNGLSLTAGGSGVCVDFQRQLAIGAPAQDLTPLGAPVNADDAIAAVTGSGGAGNVVVLSDSTLFKDVGAFNCDLGDASNAQLLSQIAAYTMGVPVPEPGSAALLGLGLLGLGLRRRRGAAALAAGLALGVGVAPNAAHAICTGTPSQCLAGEFGAPFADPLLLGWPTASKCVTDSEGELACKPAAGTLVLLDDDRFLYWNALEGTENVELGIAAEFGNVSANDQSRVLTLGPGDAPSWIRPEPNNDGGAPEDNPGGIGPADGGPNNGADGALFCSDQVILHDGRVLAAGGTDYYDEAGSETVSDGTVVPVVFPAGSVELEGLKDARIFDPSTNGWSVTGSMAFGRWYPTLVTLADGDVFVASGVTKLIKPVYPEAPFNSGRNVVQTETYDTACGSWSNNGTLAEKSLPLFPRLHLLPNGHVYFNAAGQAFNPFGQGYDQTLWNLVSAYDPAAKTWTDVAVAGFPLQLSSAGLQGLATQLNPTNPAFPGGLLTGLADEVLEDPEALAEVLGDEILTILGDFLGQDLTDPVVVQSLLGAGFRGSTFSVMLPLVPDAGGNYPVAEFLTAGGVESSIVNPSPGNYTATTSSRIDGVDVSGAQISYASRLTGPLAQPRWYGSGVLLPNGQVLAVSGADRDEVQTPGAGISVTTTELFDPTTETWALAANQGNERTYHNTAVLMRDGRVLVGGHAPITTAYGAHTQLPGFSPQDGRDPSFQIYRPPYVFRNDRPTITSVGDTSLANGQNVDVTVSSATGVKNVVLMRRTATTHLVDGDQRTVVLPLVSSNPITGARTYAVPAPSVLPPGKYLLFANTTALDGKVVPSKGVAVSVEGDVGSCP